jgi:hypothetical protein
MSERLVSFPGLLGNSGMLPAGCAIRLYDPDQCEGTIASIVVALIVLWGRHAMPGRRDRRYTRQQTPLD